MQNEAQRFSQLLTRHHDVACPSEHPGIPPVLSKILERGRALPLRADVWLPACEDDLGNAFLEKITKRFQGSTTTPVRGSYENQEGWIEIETMWVITVFAARDRLSDLGYFLKEAEELARQLEQESLLCAVDVGQGLLPYLVFLN